jgi:hypothetical protein
LLNKNLSITGDKESKIAWTIKSAIALLGVLIGVLMAVLDIAIVGPALPTIRDYFGVDDRANILFTIYVL